MWYIPNLMYLPPLSKNLKMRGKVVEQFYEWDNDYPESQPDLFDMPTISCDGACENAELCMKNQACAQSYMKVKDVSDKPKEQKPICDWTYEDYKPGIEKVMKSLNR